MIYLRVPASLVYRDVAMRVVFASCKLAGVVPEGGPVRAVTPEFGEQVVSAVGEAFNNIVLHAYRNAPTGDVSFEIELEATRLLIRILDFGHSYDPSAVPSPDLESAPESGMGLFIIRGFMDEVSYRAGSPNTLLLTKYF